MWFTFCIPLGVAGGAWMLMAPLCQLELEGDLRAGKEVVAWMSCRGKCNLCDMAALWPPFCSILAPKRLPRCLLEIGSPATLFPRCFVPGGLRHCGRACEFIFASSRLPLQCHPLRVFSVTPPPGCGGSSFMFLMCGSITHRLVIMKHE
jgi:hypothetical protein